MATNPRTISIGELDNLNVDEDNQLYWRGKLVKTHNALDLTGWQNAVALTATAAATEMAITDLWRFGCDVAWWVNSCPLK